MNYVSVINNRGIREIFHQLQATHSEQDYKEQEEQMRESPNVLKY